MTRQFRFVGHRSTAKSTAGDMRFRGLMFFRLFACLISVATTFPLVSTTAFADFTICNAARTPVAVSIGYKDTHKGWVATGWWDMIRENCTTLIAGSVKGRELAWYAQGRRSEYNWNWPAGGNLILCVTEPKKQQHFVIHQNEIRGSCKASGYGERSFGKGTVNSDDVRWTVVQNHNSLVPAEELEAKPKDRFWECWGCPEMVVVPAGDFMMGSPENEPERRSDEGPRHKVMLRQPFAVSKRKITRGEFEKFVGATGYKVADKCLAWKEGEWKEESGRSFRNPGFAQGSNHPVACVSFDDAKAYLAWLAKQTGKPYRLLSEAEWEYVVRAGTETPFWWGSSISPEQANYNGNLTYGGGAKGEFRQKTVPADSFKANPWGLFQGQGNVWEWVEDCWNKSYEGAPSDGSAWTKGDCGRRGIRGGSWASDPKFLRSAARLAAEGRTRSNDIGFRVARALAR